MIYYSCLKKEKKNKKKNTNKNKKDRRARDFFSKYKQVWLEIRVVRQLVETRYS